jgi:hypothetical protein
MDTDCFSPGYAFRFMLMLGGISMVVFILVTMPIPLVILSFSYPPLRFLLLFFISLTVVHLFLCPLIYKTFFREIGVILLYTLVVDGALLLLYGQIDARLLYAPIMAAFLIYIHVFLQFIINHRVHRNFIAKLPDGNFIHELKAFSMELKLRGRYNFILLLAFYGAGLCGYFYKWDTPFLMLRFTGYSFLCITALSIIKIVINFGRMATMFTENILPSTVEIPDYTSDDYYKLKMAIKERMSRETLRDKDGIVDYFDRAAEIRKLTYYSSLSLLLISGAYLALYSLLPTPPININLKTVIIWSCVFGLIAIQLPYCIGQKRLALKLAASYSGIEHREMLKLLGKESPAWQFINTGEIIGVGLIPSTLIWLIRLFGNLGG